MKFDNHKIFAMTLAGFCGIIGFTFSYLLIGWLLEPIESWIKSKIKGIM